MKEGVDSRLRGLVFKQGSIPRSAHDPVPLSRARPAAGGQCRLGKMISPFLLLFVVAIAVMLAMWYHPWPAASQGAVPTSELIVPTVYPLPAWPDWYLPAVLNCSQSNQ